MINYSLVTHLVCSNISSLIAEQVESDLQSIIESFDTVVEMLRVSALCLVFHILFQISWAKAFLVSRKASFQITSCLFFVTYVSVKILSALEWSVRTCVVHSEAVTHCIVMLTFSVLYTDFCFGEYTQCNHDVYCHCIIHKIVSCRKHSL